MVAHLVPTPLIADNYTKILLHFDGSNGSQTYTDTPNGCDPHTWTAATNGALSTTGQKFGTAAYSNPSSSTSAGLTTPDSADFTLGVADFSLEVWCNPDAGVVSGFSRLMGQCNSTFTTNTRSISVSRDNTTGIVTATVTLADGTTTVNVATTSAVTAGTWHHIGIARSGGSLLMFLDGVLEDTDTGLGTSAILDSSNAWGVGRMGEVTTTQWRGLLDEFRLSVGIARWTANFTPPTVAYS